MSILSKDRNDNFSVRCGAFLLDWLFTGPLVFIALGSLISRIPFPPEELDNAEGLGFYILIQGIMPQQAAMMAVGPYLSFLFEGEQVDFLSHVILIMLFWGIFVRTSAISLVECFGKGRSLGKRILGLSMTELPWYGYFLRNFCKEIAFHFLLGIPFLFCLFRQDGKTLCDMIFKTQIIPYKTQKSDP